MGFARGRGRDEDYSPPPAQFRTCSFPAYGSHLRYDAERWFDQRPDVCMPAPVTRLSSAVSGSCRADRIPLGLGPWLPRLRNGSLRLVRRLHSYYGLARLPAPVHHRLRLLAFPMRTGGLSAVGQSRDLPVSDTIFPRVMCSSTPAGWTVPRITVLPMWRSAVETTSAPSDKDISWLNHTPHAAAVYASWPSLPPAHATLASRRLARPYLGWTSTNRSCQPSWRLPQPILRSAQYDSNFRDAILAP